MQEATPEATSLRMKASDSCWAQLSVDFAQSSFCLKKMDFSFWWPLLPVVDTLSGPRI